MAAPAGCTSVHRIVPKNKKKEYSEIVLTLTKQCDIIQAKGTEADRDVEATGKKKEKREKSKLKRREKERSKC